MREYCNKVYSFGIVAMLRNRALQAGGRKMLLIPTATDLRKADQPHEVRIPLGMVHVVSFKESWSVTMFTEYLKYHHDTPNFKDMKTDKGYPCFV